MGKTRRGRNDDTPRNNWAEMVDANSRQWDEPAASDRQKQRYRRALRKNAYRQGLWDYESSDGASEKE